MNRQSALGLLLTIGCFALFTPQSGAATVDEITAKNRPQLGGKEVDWIDGDFLIQNDQIIVVVARPGKVRDANMTTRGVGACIIDMTRQNMQSDQLTAYYPAAARYKFEDASLLEHGKQDDGGVFWRCKSSASVSGDKTTCTIEYVLNDGQSFVQTNVQISGEGAGKVQASDGVRADRTFKFGEIRGTSIGFCEDEYFRQTYGFEPIAPISEAEPKKAIKTSWGGNRPKRINYQNAETTSQNGKQQSWSVKVTPASCSLDLWGHTQQGTPQTFNVSGAIGDQPRIKLSVIEGDVGPLAGRADWRCQASGKSVVHLPAGEYRIRVSAVGHEPTEHDVKVTAAPGTHDMRLGTASSVLAKVTDADGQPISCKVSFYGKKTNGVPTSSPNFGLDSQDGSVGNTVYSVDGTFVRSIPAGEYDVVISHGPEYDAVFDELAIKAGEQIKLNVKLTRTVKTPGWVSAELHSHSSPSGDNTSSQRGRVENLVCENLEFAPCTEHQRVESYDDHLQALGATQLMFTCSGMELTGKLLPINHQNAFPMKLSPYKQDGGGPRIDSRPETQIARLAMWDDSSEKIIQTNHPNMRQMIFDRDLDGKDDGGFSKMLDFMDVIEVHPPADIFRSPESFKDKRSRDRSRMKPWLDLIKSGRRIPGVVNTDAHYNWHGSGWLRNWIACSTDDPTQITIEEMIKNLEAGRVIMSTGPFMTVQLHHKDLAKPAEIGDEVSVSGPAELAIRVQCANWLDVNRVEVFVDGEMQPSIARTRKTHGDQFGNGVVKFDQRLPIDIKPGSFIVVAAIGEKMTLGRVMGERYGNRPPVVVSNPIYIAK